MKLFNGDTRDINFLLDYPSRVCGVPLVMTVIPPV
jgi:hypothetical protein